MNSHSRAAHHVHKHRGGASERGPWLRATDCAQTLARMAISCATDSEAALRTDFVALLRGLTAKGFPSEAAADGELAEAFLKCAFSYRLASTHERRARRARSLEALARDLTDILHDLRQAEFNNSWQGRTARDD